MFLLALLILWRVFQLNLDFGLVLLVATSFAGMSWFIGYLISLETLIKESKSYFLILLVILCIRSFGYEPYQIPSRSMEPGLQVGDFLLVNKHAYGLKFPGTNFSLYKGLEPKRGDVAVFYPPHTLCGIEPEEARPDLHEMSLNESRFFLNRFLTLQNKRCTQLGIKYIKRVIGLPGDIVQIKGHQLWINGDKVNQENIGKDGENILYKEIIEDKTHLIKTQGKLAYDEHKWQIPEGKYLAIGDNRDNSLDSRAWGYFSKDYLIGKAEFIWLHWGAYLELPTFERNKHIQ